MSGYKIVADDQKPGNARWLLVVEEDDGSEWPSIVFKTRESAERALDRARARGLITVPRDPSAPIVVIAASAGGLEPLRGITTAIPSNQRRRCLLWCTSAPIPARGLTRCYSGVVGPRRAVATHRNDAAGAGGA